MECCSTGQNQVGDQDPINKQLFNKTIMQFRAKVIPFYNKVKEAPKVTQKEVVDYIQVLQLKGCSLQRETLRTELETIDCYGTIQTIQIKMNIYRKRFIKKMVNLKYIHMKHLNKCSII